MAKAPARRWSRTDRSAAGTARAKVPDTAGARGAPDSQPSPTEVCTISARAHRREVPGAGQQPAAVPQSRWRREGRQVDEPVRGPEQKVAGRLVRSREVSQLAPIVRRPTGRRPPIHGCYEGRRCCSRAPTTLPPPKPKKAVLARPRTRSTASWRFDVAARRTRRAVIGSANLDMKTLKGDARASRMAS